jgi:hypothetical protein
LSSASHCDRLTNSWLACTWFVLVCSALPKLCAVNRPPSFAKVLPEPYQPLMTSETSEIVDFYPRSFTIDMNGKRWPWEAVVLLPFIDSKRLLAASASVDDSLLTESEKDRNKFGKAVVFEYDEDTSFDLEEAGDTALFRLLPGCKTKATNFDDTLLAYKEPTKPTMTPKLSDGVKYPLPAFPTLRDGSVVSIWRKLQDSLPGDSESSPRKHCAGGCSEESDWHNRLHSVSAPRPFFCHRCFKLPGLLSGQRFRDATLDRRGIDRSHSPAVEGC